MRVMVVDDSRSMRFVIRGVLMDIGYNDIVEACDGLDALSKVGGANVDLILLDWNMPNMNGIEFLKELRKRGNKTPVVMVTTEAERPRVIQAIQAGACNFVIKPFEPEELSQRVQDVVARYVKAA